MVGVAVRGLVAVPVPVAVLVRVLVLVPVAVLLLAGVAHGGPLPVGGWWTAGVHGAIMCV